MTQTVSRYFELRLYRMLPTRMPDFHELLGLQVPPLFEKCGVSRPLGFWQSPAGPYAPLFGYIMPWNSIDDRMAAWKKFYADKVWQKKLAANYAGSQRVDRPSVLILRPSDLWRNYRGQGAVVDMTGVHEMRFYRCTSHAGSGELDARIATAVDNGAEVLGLFDAEIGLPTNTRVAMLAWPDEAQRLMTRTAEAAAHPPADLQTQVMYPIPYGFPRTGLSPRLDDPAGQGADIGPIQT